MCACRAGGAQRHRDARHRDGAVPDAPGDRLPGQQYLLRTGALDAQADVASRVLDGVGQGGAEAGSGETTT